MEGARPPLPLPRLSPLLLSSPPSPCTVLDRITPTQGAYGLSRPPGPFPSWAHPVLHLSIVSKSFL